MRLLKFLLLLLLFVTIPFRPGAQKKCATMDVLKERFAKNPATKSRFESRATRLKQIVSYKLQAPYKVASDDPAVVPVVFHIVSQNPSSITDEQIRAQLNILNKSFSGTNEDSVKIPAYFKQLFGKNALQFCLAARTPDGEESTGILRYTTGRPSFGTNNDIKYASRGGADAWNPEKYINVWLCKLSNGVLGYATFPDYGDLNEQGIVVDYATLPGSTGAYGKGKTLVHEAGHYFDLFHIWGDDDGACTGSDHVDDTPNQGGATQGCATGVKNDACNASANGVLYQNYMDYSDDDCLVLFTKEQVLRMRTSLAEYRSTLLTSNGCQPVVIHNLDAELKTILEPADLICSPLINPKVAIGNKGKKAITSLTIRATIGDQTTTYHYKGDLAFNQTDTVTLPLLNTGTGKQTLTIFLSRPNDGEDEDKTNDTLSKSFQYNEPFTVLSESFEGDLFPPEGWSVINPDHSYTWERTANAAKTAKHSVVIKNYSYEENGQKDYLRLPVINISGADSAFFSFQVAAAVQSPINLPGNLWDTLEVYISTDCGKSYQSIYKKWGYELITRKTRLSEPFIPNKDEWRKDSINLAPYIQNNNVLLMFVNTTEFENNIFIDDVNVRKVSVNENLRKAGFLVTPNPASDIVNIDFYPQPNKLIGIRIYNTAGQAVKSIAMQEGAANNHYQFNLADQAAGIYFVRAIFSDKVLVKKLVIK